MSEAPFVIPAPAQTATAASSRQFVYVGTYTGSKSKGIYRAEFDSETGKLGSPTLAATTPNPTFLAVNHNHGILYAINEVNNFDTHGSGSVSAFKINQVNGDLELLNQQPSGGSGPCHLAVARNGKCVLVANYGSGGIAVLPLQQDGRLDPPSMSIQHSGSSVNHQRQQGPHAHFITWDPQEHVVLTCDLGLDKVLLYRLDPAHRVLITNDPPFLAIRPGSGPRHLAFHPNGRYAYVLNELSSTVTCCSYSSERGELQEIQTISTLPNSYTGGNTCAEVQVDPSGKHLYASNRGHDSVAVFAIDPGSGRLSLQQHASTQGKTPRHFTLDPAAHWLLAENQDSDSVVVFKVDLGTGGLISTGESQSIGAPVCAVFVPSP